MANAVILAPQPSAASYSPAPSGPKSNIMRFYESLRGLSPAVVTPAMARVQETAQIARSGGEAFLTGLVLGLIDAEFGLDKTKVPLDAIGAGVAYGSAFYFAGEGSGISTDLRNVGSDCLAVLTYRKAKAARERAGKSAVPAHGDDEEDPIILAGKMLGQDK